MPQDILAGGAKIKNETLQGLIPPTTYKPLGPQPDNPCYFGIRFKSDGTFDAPKGLRPRVSDVASCAGDRLVTAQVGGLACEGIVVRFGGLVAVNRAGAAGPAHGVDRSEYVTRAPAAADYVFLLNRGTVAFAGQPTELDADELAERYVGAGH